MFIYTDFKNCKLQRRCKSFSCSLLSISLSLCVLRYLQLEIMKFSSLVLTFQMISKVGGL